MCLTTEALAVFLNLIIASSGMTMSEDRIIFTPLIEIPTGFWPRVSGAQWPRNSTGLNGLRHCAKGPNEKRPQRLPGPLDLSDGT